MLAIYYLNILFIRVYTDIYMHNRYNCIFLPANWQCAKCAPFFINYISYV